MTRANVNDRGSIERVYPPDAFAVDAADNDKQPGNQVLHGVRIVSAPDAHGAFELERADRQVGEIGGALFLAPFRRSMGHDFAGRAPDPASGYEAFIDEIIAAAPCFGFREETSPGIGDARLQGPRQ
jgi:hypothetical protein